MALALLPNFNRTVVIPEIGPFRIRLRTHRSFWLRNPIDSERMIFGAMQRLTVPGDVCYDVGANVGLHTRFLATVFQAGKVISFEPMSANFELLQINAELDRNAAQRIRIYHMALADTDGEELLQVDDMMSASAVLDRVTGGAPSHGRQQYGLEAKTEKVRLARLDSLMNAEQIPPPNFIKIDIEGAEALMLKGAFETLKKYRPRLAIEMHSVEITHDVLQLLDEVGYDCFAAVHDNGRAVYRQIHAADTIGRASPYDIHFVFCSTNPEDLHVPIAEYGR